NTPCATATSTMSASARRTVIAADCSVSSGELAVEPLDVADQTIEAVTRDHRRAPSFAHRLSRGRVGEQTRDRRRQSGRIVEGRERAGGLVDHVANAADVGRDTWNSGGQAFDQR